MRTVKQYDFNGLAGCVTQRKSRESKVLVGLYQAAQAGMEIDPETPWATVCEDHGNIVCHPTLTAAHHFLGFPAHWCDDCRDKQLGVETPPAEPPPVQVRWPGGIG